LTIGLASGEKPVALQVEKDTNELDLRLKISFLCYNESVEKACHGWTALVLS